MKRNAICLVLTGMFTIIGCGSSDRSVPVDSNESEAPETKGAATPEVATTESQAVSDDEGTTPAPEMSVAAEPAESESAFSPGLEIGTEAPKFGLSDQDGQTRKLDDLLKDGPVALVFYRSADW